MPGRGRAKGYLTHVDEGHIGETAEIIEFDFDESSPVPRGWMLTPVVAISQP
jgi:hypothetical protein